VRIETHKNLPRSVEVPLRILTQKLGYEIHRIERSRDGPYTAVRPLATYSPWNRDKRFLETYRIIQAHTLVDIYRCFELWTLVGQVKKLRGSLIEVGVWRGGTGALIAKRASMCGIRETVYLCDTFGGVVKASDKDSQYKGGEHSDTSKQVVESLLATLGLTNAWILAGIFPEETAKSVEKQSFSFCHIDVDVYQSAKDAVDWIWERIVSGGILVYDDYGFRSCDGITRYVEEQISEPDRLIIHNLNGHAIVVKIK
jgi:O-methyltransferase